MQPAPVLRWAAATEAVTVTVLLVNLLTVHWQPVSSVIGPTHGCAYLLTVLAVMRRPDAGVRARAAALLPGVGGLVSLRLLRPGPR